MCGIAGIYSFTLNQADADDLHRMTREMIHRGPDDEGFFIDREIGLGFRRLSILDLSQSGHQPMSNADRTLWIVFNGEIYNYIELREELKTLGYAFRSQTDTEVILAAYDAWGENCLNRFNGMWAFAIWDVKKRELFCARDRFGVKPFYYFRDKENFVFASEIKCILTHPRVRREPNENIIAHFLIENIRDWNDETFFRDIFQLQPGHCLRICKGAIDIRPYYRLDPDQKPSSGLSDEAAAERFYELFEDAVKLRLRSDVPVGSCLSGGLDSSSIVCVLNRLLKSESVSGEQIGDRQKTFSAHSELKSVDESRYMDAVVEQTGAERNIVLPTDRELARVLDHFITHLEEPFPSTSIFAQYCVMRLAQRRGIKVLLDGQGADETLAGYNHAYMPYFAGLLRKGRLWRLWKESRLLERKLSPGAWLTIVFFALPAGIGSYLYSRSILRLPYGVNRNFMKSAMSRKKLARDAETGLNQKLLNDMRYILRSLLMYEDKNSMAFSIESRVPFLDYRLVEYVFSLPDRFKIRRGLRKAVLRDAMKGVVPDMILERRDKIGFATAEMLWLCEGPLRKKMLEIFESESFSKRKYFDAPAILDAFKKLPSQSAKKQYINFWGCFNLELWLRKYMDPERTEVE